MIKDKSKVHSFLFKITDVNSLFQNLNYYTYFRIIINNIIIIDCIIIIIIIFEYFIEVIEVYFNMIIII